MLQTRATDRQTHRIYKITHGVRLFPGSGAERFLIVSADTLLIRMSKIHSNHRVSVSKQFCSSHTGRKTGRHRSASPLVWRNRSSGRWSLIWLPLGGWLD